MKACNYIWFLVVIILCFACKDDDNENIIYFDPPTSAVDNIGEDEIRLLISPNSSYLKNDSLVFTIGLGTDKTKKIQVNWGDDNVLHSYPAGRITHQYIDANKEYIVTIKAPGIESFDYDHQKSVHKTKSVAFGHCPDLTSFSAYIYENIYENFDLSQCPQFSGPVEFYTYANNFNFSGFKNFTDIFISCKNLIPVVEMKDMNFTRLRLNLLEGYSSGNIEKLYIENRRPDIEYLGVSLVPSGNSSFIPIEDFVLDVSRVKYLSLSRFMIKDKFDFSGIEYLESLTIYNSYYTGIKMPENMKYVWLDNQWLDYYNPQIELLDFSKCSELESVSLLTIPYLMTVNIEGLKNLTQFNLYKCPDTKVIGEQPQQKSSGKVKRSEDKNKDTIDKYTLRLKAGTK